MALKMISLVLSKNVKFTGDLRRYAATSTVNFGTILFLEALYRKENQDRRKVVEEALSKKDYSTVKRAVFQVLIEEIPYANKKIGHMEEFEEVVLSTVEVITFVLSETW